MLNIGVVKSKAKGMTTQLNNHKGLNIKFTPQELNVIKTIGNGNMTEGVRVSIMWASHFWNLGLNPEMDLGIIGLVTVSTTDKHPNE